MLGLAQFFLLYIIPFSVKRISEYFSPAQIKLLGNFKSQDEKEERESVNLCREDVEMVMGSLGIFCNLEGENFKGMFGIEEFSKVFEENEPSLDEIREAFDVFDENRDGFVDANELKRVLFVLGFKEGLEIEKCKKMIKAFDVNGDERIDFNEFVKFMEKCFC